jgi:SAM-dependent methyltransferase
MGLGGSPSLLARHLEPELLDVLPPTHPEATGSRRDLVRINALMFQPFIMRRLLARHLQQPPRRILEIGAGDGRFMLAIARRMARRWPNVELVLLDRAPVVSDALSGEFAELGWRAEAVVADVFDWAEKAGRERFDVVAANLFLHHFDDAALSRLFAAIAALTPLFAATDPWRAGFPLFATRLLPAIGANRVTLHDATASVRAGFSGSELAQLWPSGRGRVLEERRVGAFTHVFAAAGDR